MRLGGQRTPKRINNLNFELAARQKARQNGTDHNRIMLKSNANSSSDSNQNNRNTKREACSDDSPTNIYNRLTVRTRSYD